MATAASASVKDSLALTDSIAQDVALAAEIDSAIFCYYEELQALTNEFTSYTELSVPDSVPVFKSAVYAERLAALDRKTPFDLGHNSTVEAFIHLYVAKKRTLSAKCLARSEQYFPMFEETLDRWGLPLELKYLAVVESALDPRIKSKAGATGLWQFMYGTAKVFGLRIDSYVDERCDPVKSTEAACKYLVHLHKMFGDWNLALAAYNCGEGRVTRAIRRSGGKKDYWELYPYLPTETRGYVPAFVAVNYLFGYAAEHGIVPQTSEPTQPHTDTIHVNHPMRFEQIGALLNLSNDEIAALNPIYKTNYVPAYEPFNVLTLPKEKVNIWVSNESKFKEKMLTPVAQAAPAPTAEPQSTTTYYYTVKSGDYLGRIAERHNCSVSELQRWNNLRSTSIRPGQRLVVGVGPQKASTTSTTNSADGNIYYIIRSGDSLWRIAQNKGVSIDDLKRWNNNITHLRPGQKIVVGKA